MSKPGSEQLTACAVFHQEVAADGVLPSRIQLMPIGTHRPRNGVPPVVILADRAHAEAVVAASDAYRGPQAMVIDYDHQTVRAPGVAGRAAAAGWVERLVVEDDGIWGEVEWTAAASAEIADRRYRYISPYFAHRPDGRVTRIINAGLTNTPNLDLAAVASAMNTGDSMTTISLLAVATALGLSDSADEPAVMAAIARTKAASDALTATASALGVTLGEDLTSAASAIQAKAAKPDPARFVPIETVAELRSEMSALQATVDGLQGDRKAAIIADAKAKGKLPPSLEKHAESLDMTALASFLAALPETGLGKPMLPGGKPDDEQGAALEDELAIASSHGLSADEFRAARKAEEKLK